MPSAPAAPSRAPARSGSSPTTMRPPSSGGIGSRLNSAEHQVGQDEVEQEQPDQRICPIAASHSPCRPAIDVRSRQQQRRHPGEEEVHRRPGHGHHRHAAARIAELPGRHRHRLGPAEHEHDPVDGQQLEDQQEARQQDGADPIDVAQRVERQPAGLARGVVAERQRRVAVRRLVQGDRQDRRDDGEGELKRRCRSRQQPIPFGRQRGAVQRQAPPRRQCPGRDAAARAPPRSAAGSAPAGRRSARIAAAVAAPRRSRPPAPAAPDRPACRSAPSSRDRRSPALLRSRSGRG